MKFSLLYRNYVETQEFTANPFKDAMEDEGVKVNAFGAYARHCGEFDINKYFSKKVK